VYEDAVETPLLTGSFTLFDDDDSVGCYVTTLAITSGNGFEAGKSYSVRITGVVGGVTGVEIHQFDVSATLLSDGVAVTSIANDAITAASINTGALTADAFAADAIVAATLATGVLTADAFAADAIVAATLATNAITADALATDAVAEIADGVWDELTAGHAVAGTTGKALSDAGAAGDPWAAATRTLTSTAAATLAAVTGSALAITRSATYEATLSGMTIGATWKKIWLTLKEDTGLTDAKSTAQIVESNPGAVTDGMLYLNGAAASSAALGVLVVDQSAGTVAITITDEATATLTAPASGTYDLKCLLAAGTTSILTAGTYTVSTTPTAAIV
jgi:hypothetical protein